MGSTVKLLDNDKHMGEDGESEKENDGDGVEGRNETEGTQRPDYFALICRVPNRLRIINVDPHLAEVFMRAK